MMFVAVAAPLVIFLVALLVGVITIKTGGR
jgi:hypothetical protein